jgi:hypothetical protein
MAQQSFVSVTNIVPIASQTALTATSEEVLVPTAYTGIAANEAYPGKAWRLTIGGIMSWASTGTLTLTPRVGLVIGGITLGVSVVALTTPGATTNHAFYLQFILVCRTIGLPGANSTFIGTGMFHSSGIGTLGTGTTQSMGGTSATADASIATGIWMGKTLSVAGTMTTQYSIFESLN